MEENNIQKKDKISQQQIAGAIIIAGVIIAGAILLKGGGAPVVKDYTKSSPVFNQCLDSGKYAKAVEVSKNEGTAAGVTGTPKGFILRDGKVVATIDGAEPLGTIKQKIDKALAESVPIKAVQELEKVSSSELYIGNLQAKVMLVMYEDFQCPFCGKFFKESEQSIRDTYVKNGEVLLVYGDFAFLGPESEQSAEAARCAGEQNKFWEYHDYLYSHQMGENQGAFSTPNLKSFAGQLKLK